MVVILWRGSTYLCQVKSKDNTDLVHLLFEISYNLYQYHLNRLPYTYIYVMYMYLSKKYIR